MKYTSKPKYDLFFIGWNEPALRDNKQIWAHRPFHWLPYYGDRLTTDMQITFDGRYKVMTNGVRESVKENKDGTRTWHYKMYKEHPFFSTCLVIGDYKFLEMKTKGRSSAGALVLFLAGRSCRTDVPLYSSNVRFLQ